MNRKWNSLFYLFVLFFSAISIQGQELWRVRDATTSIQFNELILKDLGVRVVERNTTGTAYRQDYEAFRAESGPSLFFEAPLGDFEHLSGGMLRHQGGYVFSIDGANLSLNNFEIRVGSPPDELILSDSDGRPLFRLLFAHPYLKPESKQLLLLNMDMVATREFAALLRRPDLEEIYLGTVDLTMIVDAPESIDFSRGTCPPNFIGDVDVVLTSIGTPSQFAREAGGRVAISTSASLANGGTADVPWFRAIEPDGNVPPEEIGQHPYLVQHFYRIHNGVLEQLGRSDVKHAFFSVNSGCACPGGQILYVGCSDSYGAGTNVNRFYLAPRDELTASIGDWTARGSHFDATPVDEVRDHGSGGHDDFDHRLFVQEPELQTAGATYFMEVWYIVKDDINIFNSLGYREVVPSLVGATWSFQVPKALVNAPALEAWVHPNQPTENQINSNIDTGSGHLQLAVKVTPLPENQYHYEYALMNLDFDRKIDSFTLPFSSGTTISNAESGRPGVSSPDDWQVVVGADQVVWRAPAGQGLDWGVLYNFRFDSSSPPTEGDGTLGVLEPGLFDEIVVATRVPEFCVSMETVQQMYPNWQNNCTVLELVDLINQLCL